MTEVPESQSDRQTDSLIDLGGLCCKLTFRYSQRVGIGYRKLLSIYISRYALHLLYVIHLDYFLESLIGFLRRLFLKISMHNITDPS